MFVPLTTVGQLIEALKPYPPEMEVRFPVCLLDGCDGYADNEFTVSNEDGILRIETVYAGDTPGI